MDLKFSIKTPVSLHRKQKNERDSTKRQSVLYRVHSPNATAHLSQIERSIKQGSGSRQLNDGPTIYPKTFYKGPFYKIKE